eukprot:5980849-Prymnesium_polylepis.3
MLITGPIGPAQPERMESRSERPAPLPHLQRVCSAKRRVKDMHLAPVEAGRNGAHSVILSNVDVPMSMSMSMCVSCHSLRSTAVRAGCVHRLWAWLDSGNLALWVCPSHRPLPRILPV